MSNQRGRKGAEGTGRVRCAVAASAAQPADSWLIPAHTDPVIGAELHFQKHTRVTLSCNCGIPSEGWNFHLKMTD